MNTQLLLHTCFGGSGSYIFSNLDFGSKQDARFVAVRAMGLWRLDDLVSLWLEPRDRVAQ